MDQRMPTGQTLVSTLKRARLVRQIGLALTMSDIEKTEWWPTQRGTPPHRPLDYNQEYTRRPWANGIPEQIFTRSMIGVGVQTIGLANTIWRWVHDGIVESRFVLTAFLLHPRLDPRLAP